MSPPRLMSPRPANSAGARGRQHAHLAGTGPQLRRADRRHDAGDGPGESVVSQPSDRVRGEETVRSPASPGVVVEAERGGFASPGGAALTKSGEPCRGGAAPPSESWCWRAASM